uniref:Uncharacterized protein n=1 Tax=Caenorhabditis japonica TaxID=281687 RepID=A0A8R1I4K5_CAEJA
MQNNLFVILCLKTSMKHIILIYKIPFGFVTEDLCVSVSKAHDGVELSTLGQIKDRCASVQTPAPHGSRGMNALEE